MMTRPKIKLKQKQNKSNNKTKMITTNQLQGNQASIDIKYGWL